MNNFRIKKAIELFAVPSLKVREIAEKVGYTNANTFTRIFKKHMGVTPEEYRKECFRM